MDLNGDGLVTPEECLKWLKTAAAENTRAEEAQKAAPRVGDTATKGKYPPTGGEPALVVKPTKTGDVKEKLKLVPGEKKKD